MKGPAPIPRKRDPRDKAAALASRFIDLKIIARRRKTGEDIFQVGGQWDTVENCFTDEQPKTCVVFLINESQVPAAIALGEWLKARTENTKRVVEMVLEGARGSGKTHLAALVIVCIAVAFPDARCWLVNPANTRRAEVDIIIRDHVPDEWLAGWSERDLTYTLPNGSTLQYIGGDDDEQLRQGGYEVCLLNEATLIRSESYAAAAGGVRNVSGRPKGLLLLAHNPATRTKGEWTGEHLQRIFAGEVNAKHFRLDPRLNDSIDSDVVDDVDALIRSVRPDLADADALGIHRRLGDLACHAFRAWSCDKLVKIDDVDLFGHIGDPGEIWFPDITRELTKAKLHTAFSEVGGLDFQGKPHTCGLLFRFFRRGDGKTIYYAHTAALSPDWEQGLSERFYEIGYDPREIVFIADSSGAWQAVDRSATRIKKSSHELLREEGWVVHPVTKPHDRKNRGTSGAGHNPDVGDNLSLLNDVVEDGRLLVSPSCTWLVESLRKGKLRHTAGRVFLDGDYAHILDCLRYVIHYFEPARKRPMRKSGAMLASSFPAMRPGAGSSY